MLFNPLIFCSVFFRGVPSVCLCDLKLSSRGASIDKETIYREIIRNQIERQFPYKSVCAETYRHFYMGIIWL